MSDRDLDEVVRSMSTEDLRLLMIVAPNEQQVMLLLACRAVARAQGLANRETGRAKAARRRLEFARWMCREGKIGEH